MRYHKRGDQNDLVFTLSNIFPSHCFTHEPIQNQKALCKRSARESTVDLGQCLFYYTGLVRNIACVFHTPRGHNRPQGLESLVDLLLVGWVSRRRQKQRVSVRGTRLDFQPSHMSLRLCELCGLACLL